MSEELEAGSAATEPSLRSEWVKFGVLATILLGSVLVVALLRPYIFNQLVPAIMGEGVTPAGQPAPELTPDQQILVIPIVGGEVAPGEEAPETPPTEAYPAPITEPPAPEMETAVPETAANEEGASETAVGYILHTVQAGENLTLIAQRYNVTIADILAANTIANANRIEAGAILRIPQK